MSNSLVPLPVISVQEPRVKLENERVFAIIKGGQTVTYYKYPASSYSNSNFNFSTNPPSKQTILDRIAMIQVPFTLDFAGTGAGTGNILQPGRDAFRNFPLASVVKSLTCSINGFPVTIESSDIIHLLSRFHVSDELRKRFMSICPQMNDTYQNYVDADGANNNPLANYADNTLEPPRGAYPYVIVSNTSSAARITGTLCEYVVLPPFLWDGTEAGGLTHLDTLSFNYVFAPYLDHMWSRSTANTQNLTSINVAFGQPNMLLGFITPRLTDIQRMPASINYPYFQINKYVTQSGLSLAPGINSDIRSNIIQLNSIPRKLYLFAKQSDTVRDLTFANRVNYTDTFMRIENVRLNWDNQEGILSGAAAQSLYQLSVMNGLEMSWPEWYGSIQNFNATGATGPAIGTVGSVICLEMGKDVGLRDDQAVGILGQYNLQVTLNVTNVNPTVTYSPDLYIIAVYDGVLTISNNSAIGQIGVISSRDVLTAPNSNVNYNELQKIYGGDFFSSFKNIAGDVIRKADRAAQKVLPYAQQANQLLKDTKAISRGLNVASIPATLIHPGLGTAAEIGSDVARVLGYGEGGVLVGGQRADMNAMKRRLRNA